MPIYTVGYGGRTTEQLFDLLRNFEITHLVDVRSSPFGMFPEFNRPQIDEATQLAKLKYVFMGTALGGKPTFPEGLDDDGLVDYEIVRQQVFFKTGINQLIKAVDRPGNQLCLMCAERRPGDCHRSKLIGEELAQLGYQVIHIIERDEVRTQHEVMNDQPSLF